MDKEKEGLRLRVVVRRTGNSLAMTIPESIVDFMNVKEGDELSVTAVQGKKGKYLAAWLK